jgi:regulatory protein
MNQTITALKAQKRNPERVNVYLDGEFAFGLARIIAAWLEVGQELTSEKILQLQAQDQVEIALQQAIKLIGYRPRSVAEVRRNLSKHAYPEDTIETVLDRLQKNGLLDDRIFARRWVENRIAFRPRGRRALSYELRKAGIDDHIIQETLDEMLNDEDQLAYAAASKYAARLKVDDRQVFNHKLSGFLARKGFSYETAAAVVARCWQEAESHAAATADNEFKNEVDE